MVHLTFFFGRFVFLLCSAPSGLGLPPSLPLPLPFLVALALCFGCFSRPPAARLFVCSRLVGVSRLAVGCSLVVSPPPPPFLCLAVSGAPAWCPGGVFFFFLPLLPLCASAFSGFRPRVPWASALCVVCFVGPPPLGSPCACPSFVLSAWLVVAPRRLLPPPAPPFCLAVFVAAARRCGVLCCAVCPWVRCCAALLRVVSSGVVLSCAVLCSLGAAACCAVPSGAARCPGALCSAALRFAVLPRAVCVLSWRGGACCCSPLCFVLCVSRGAVLCVPCPLRSVWCCASLCWCACVVLFVWCVLLLVPGAVVCRGAVLGLVARGCLLVACFGVGVPVWPRGLLPCGWCGLVWCPAFLCRVLCCWGLLCPPVGCRALLCCAVGWLCCFLPAGGVCVLWCSFPRAVRSLSTPLCALRCLVVLAVVPRFPVSCAVALCCRVVLCCRALLSVCGAACVCFALLRPVVRCWCLVLWRVPVRCGVSLGVLRCGGTALVCRGVLLCCALSCGVLRPVPCPAVPCCPAVLCWFAVLCGCLRCWCLFFLLSSFPLCGCGCTYLKNRCKISYNFFFFFFENKKKLYTNQHTRVQQDHVRCRALRVTRRSCCSWPCTCAWRRGACCCPLLRVDRVPPGPLPKLQGKGSDGHEGRKGGAWRRRRKRRLGAT